MKTATKNLKGFIKLLINTLTILILFTFSGLQLNCKTTWIWNLDEIFNHGCLHCAFLEPLYDLKAIRAHEAEDEIQNVQRFWEVENVSKQHIKFNKAMEATALHARYLYIVTSVGHYYAETIESLECTEFHIFKLLKGDCPSIACW